MKKAFYFSHDSNARNDEKILMLRAEHGWEGYGVFWVLVEMMFETEGTSIQHKNLKGIAVACNIELNKLEAIVSTAIAEELFKSDGEEFWSESLRKRKNNMEYIKLKQSEAGKKAMANRYKKNNFNKSVVSDLEGTCNNKINKNKINNNVLNNTLEDSEDINPDIYKHIIEYLNLKTGKKFKINSRKNRSFVKARLNEGYSLEDFKKVIDIKSAQWLNDPKMEQYLCPETLFSPKFEKYLNQKLIDNGKFNNRTKTVSDFKESARDFIEVYGEGSLAGSTDGR